MTDFAENHVTPGRESLTVYATAAKSGDTVSVWINGTTVTVKCARDLTVAQNDVLLLQRTGMFWTAIARLGTAAVAPPLDNGTAPPPQPTTVTGTSVFGPVETRSYRSGGFTGWRTDNDDVYQGQYGGNGLHRGCAFYGGGPRALAGATVTGCWIQVRRKSGGGITAAQTTTLWGIAESTRPGGAPTLQSSTTGPSLAWGGVTNFGFPQAFGQALVNGTTGGLAIYTASGSPYVILDGKGSYGPSFTLTIAWSR
jgi:hypothetical protein